MTSQAMVQAAFGGEIRWNTLVYISDVASKNFSDKLEAAEKRYREKSCGLGHVGETRHGPDARPILIETGTSASFQQISDSLFLGSRSMTLRSALFCPGSRLYRIDSMVNSSSMV